MLTLFINIFTRILIVVSLLSLILFVPPAIERFCAAFISWSIHKFSVSKHPTKKQAPRQASRFPTEEARRQYAKDLFRQIA